MAILRAMTAPMPPPMARPARISTAEPNDGLAATSVTTMATAMPIMP